MSATTKGFSISRGMEIQKAGTDIMKKESPLLFLLTIVLILWVVAGAITNIALGNVSKSITPVIVLCNLPLEVLSFVLVASKLSQLYKTFIIIIII